jgi:hypothetical protein
LERIVTSDAVGEIIGDEHRELGWNDEFIETSACLRASENFLSAIDSSGEGAVRERVFSDYSLMYQDWVNNGSRRRLSTCPPSGQQIHDNEDNRDDEYEMDKAAPEMQHEAE